MSSATSTDSTGTTKVVPSIDVPSVEVAIQGSSEGPDNAALQPWQFFLLAGMLGATAAVIVITGQSMASIVTLSLTVVAASMAGLGAYRTLVPLVGPAVVRPSEKLAGRARAALEREKTLVLRAIKDLEFDRGMGKVDPTDFAEMSARLRGRAVALMQQLEGTVAHRARIEQELAERLAKTPLKAKAARPETSATAACASCGTPNDADARFCKACGTKIEAAR